MLALSGNMDVAMDMASSRIRCNSAARERMKSRPPSCWLGCAGEATVTPSSRFLRMALAVAIVNLVREREFTVTRAFHSAREYGGLGI